MVEAAFVTHFLTPPIYPYLPFALGYLTSIILGLELNIKKVILIGDLYCKKGS